MGKSQELYKLAQEKARQIVAMTASGAVLDEAALKTMGDLEKEVANLQAQARALKSAEGIIDEAGQVTLPAGLPTDAEPKLPQGDADELKAAINAIRYGAVNDPTDKVMRAIYGGDYRQVLFDQDQAFKMFLRRGADNRLLHRQLWGPDDVTQMLKDGLSEVEIKTTMIEGQDTLGAYAVPPQRAAEILSRVPGFTAVRAGGARVIQTASNMIEWLGIKGSGNLYPSGLRGAWGTEVQSPDEKDFALDLKQITVRTYTYKVSFSQNLVENASNLVQLFTEMVAVVLAIDEDKEFLVGDGAKAPRGILPSLANAHGLAEKASGVADALKVEGVKALRRGVASQYRAPGRASWIGNSGTAEIIETFQDGVGRFYFDYLDSGEVFMRSAWRESESMPEIAADAYPLIFGDLSGYAIVERLGLAIARFQDSATGINKVEFQVRRLIGGDVIEPWKLAVMKVAVSV